MSFSTLRFISVTKLLPFLEELVKKPKLDVYKRQPVDCVKLALHTVVPRRPDVVIGGINHGDNSSVNVHYLSLIHIYIHHRLHGLKTSCG